jgi:hypothetical protein
MAEEKMTIGKAIDVIENALTSFDAVDQATILTAVCSHLKIIPPSQLAAQRAMHQNSPEIKGQVHAPPAGSRAFDVGVDIKSLKNEKQPSSASQMACVVAYYLSEHAPESERKDTIKSADLEKYFKQANYRLPEKMEQLLVDAKRSGYFDNVGRGEYKLTRVGYNLVTQSMPASKDAR